MTVAELIVRLQQMPPSLPVCLGDWNEEYLLPSESAAEIVKQLEGKYRRVLGGEIIEGRFVCLGAEDARWARG